MAAVVWYNKVITTVNIKIKQPVNTVTISAFFQFE